MSDLSMHVREYVEAEVSPVDVDRLVERLYATDEPVVTRASRQPHRLRTAIAVATMTILAVGGLFLLGGRGRSTDPAVTSTPPSPTTSLPASPALDLFQWQSAELPGGLASILEFDGSYVAHLVTADGYPSDAASWLVTSIDGLNWAPLLEQPQWAGHGQGLGVYPHGGSLWTATVVHDGGPEITVERLDTVGLGWFPVRVEGSQPSSIRDVWFVAGEAGVLLFAIDETGEPFLWVLERGALRPVEGGPLSALPFAAGEGDWPISGDGLVYRAEMIATERGFLVVLAADDAADLPAALYSNDGRLWASIADMPDLWLTAHSLGAHRGRLMSFGEGGLYRSIDDGLRWTRVETDRDIAAMSITAGPLGWIVPDGQAGIFWDGPTDLLISADGEHWDVALEDVPVVHGMLVTDDAVVFGASRGGWGPVTYEVWIGRPTG